MDELLKYPDPTARVDYDEMVRFILPHLQLSSADVVLTNMAGLEALKARAFEMLFGKPDLYYYGMRAADIADRCARGQYNMMCPVSPYVDGKPCMTGSEVIL